MMETAYTILDDITSFAKRKAYCHGEFIKLATGSSRIVYDLGEDRVLKLAYNRRGLAQNATESDQCMHDMYPTLFTKILACSPDDKWILCENAKPVGRSELEKHLGMSLDDLGSYLIGRTGGFIKADWNLSKKGDANTLVQEILDWTVNFDIAVPDIINKTAWGKVHNTIVLRDYGLTKTTWCDYY